MESLENTPIWRYLGLLVVVLGVLVGGTWLTVKVTTEHLLYENASPSYQLLVGLVVLWFSNDIFTTHQQKPTTPPQPG